VSLVAIKPVQVLWSPAAPESKPSNRSSYAKALSKSLKVLASTAPLLDLIVVQDSVGKASNASDKTGIRYPVGCMDAAWHANVTRDALKAFNVTVAINMVCDLSRNFYLSTCI
jgi:hypothetical protein